MLTVWETNMIYYKRIVEALVAAGRGDSLLFIKIENHILNNLSMPYELPTIVDILHAYHRAGKGSLRLYDAIQYTIAKGHLFHANPFLVNRIQLPLSGRLTAKLLEIYGDVDKREPGFIFYPEFRALVYKIMVNKNTVFELPDVINNIKDMNNFKFEDHKEIE